MAMTFKKFKFLLMSVILAKLMSLPIRNFVIHTPTSLFKRYLTTTIVTVGKKNGVEPWISAGCSEYEKRINSVIDLETIFLKSDDALLDYIPSLRGTIIALDENGKEFTSREFSSYFYKALENGGAHVSLIIGGFSGLPSEIRNKYPLISIGKMTWTHQMARLLLLEQIYRAIEIRKGSSYHKD